MTQEDSCSLNIQHTDVNARNAVNLTPVYYSIYQKNFEEIKDHLNRGASLAVKDELNMMPIDDVDTSDSLKKILDILLPTELITEYKHSRGEGSAVELEIKTHNLLLPKDYKTAYQDIEVGLLEFFKKYKKSEILLKIAEKFQDQLMHPVILSFIAALWFQARNKLLILFFINGIIVSLFLYFTLVQTKTIFFTIISALIWSGKAIIQFVFILDKYLCYSGEYFRIFENALYLITYIILFILNISIDSSEVAAFYSISFLIVTIEYIFMFSVFFKLVEMLKLIFTTFRKTLILLVILQLTITICFYSLSKPDNKMFLSTLYNMTISIVTAEMKEEFENTFWIDVTSKMMFVVFVLFICITLVNFLNSLAVNDISQLEKDAELSRIILLVQYLYKIELIPFLKIEIGDQIVLKGDRKHSVFSNSFWDKSYLPKNMVKILNKSLVEAKKTNIEYFRFKVTIKKTRENLI